jgi:sec-independent protein translocase protein TatB
MGFGEVLFIALIAIVFLGPDKLPNAMVKTAKFFRAVKKHLTEAKAAIDSEINLSELKSDALEYKEKLKKEVNAAATPPSEIKSVAETGREIKDLFGDLSDLNKKEKASNA